MMKKKRNAILLASTTNSLSVSVETVFYIVKKGDTLSNILYKKNVKPIYGKRGQLVEVLKLNPEIKKDNDNKIYPGMRIAFSYEENSAKIVSTDNRQQTT